MKRGDLYRVRKGVEPDPRAYRVFVVVSRNTLIRSKHSTVICAPVYSTSHGLSTQVTIDHDEGLKHTSSIHCDELVSLPKQKLTDYVGSLSAERVGDLNKALAIAVGLI